MILLIRLQLQQQSSQVSGRDIRYPLYVLYDYDRKKLVVNEVLCAYHVHSHIIFLNLSDIIPVYAFLGNNKIPIRRLSLSKRPSLPNVMEDKESNMSDNESDNYFAGSMDSINVVPKRRSLAGRKSKSRRGSAQKKNSLENVLEDKEAGGGSVNISAIHLSDSSSISSASLGTSSSSMMGSSLAGSVNIMDFGVSQTIRPASSYIDKDDNDTPSDTKNPSQRSIDSSSKGTSILSGPDGFIGWKKSSMRNSVSSKKKKRGWRKKMSVPKRGLESKPDSVISNLTMGSSRLDSVSSNITRSSNLSSKVDEDGFLNWSSGRGSSDSNSIDTFSSDKKEEEEEEAKKVTNDDVVPLKKSASGNGLARRIRRVSTNLTASLTNGGGTTGNQLRNSLVQKRNSNGSDDNTGTGFRHSTGQDGPNRRPTNSLFSSVFTRRSSSGGDDTYRRGSGDNNASVDGDAYFSQNLRSRLNKRDSETCVDISELRRDIVTNDEGKKWKLKNVIF